ncbi:hypothetical protein E6W39_26050 [Kitasatospora acidiphila]|uniref:Uncharacterized protein n=1 Tax=Kitasatospora acidiphila TaxID=2567942 RepID=A0A540W7R1_9ACTN|nr:hypothetical protein [Kitasatospora acidiphila]TQF05066.1 hypothetical protein E6W39_26050 [Kitasatospora acidiphila]
MKRHRFDLFSFLAGGLFTVLAVLYLVASLNHAQVNGRIVVPVTLIVLGAAGLAGAVAAAVARRGRDD